MSLTEERIRVTIGGFVARLVPFTKIYSLVLFVMASCSQSSQIVATGDARNLVSDSDAARLSEIAVSTNIAASGKLTPRVKFTIATQRTQAYSRATLSVFRLVSTDAAARATESDTMVSTGKGLTEYVENGISDTANKFLHYLFVAKSNFGHVVSTHVSIPSLRTCDASNFVYVRGSEITGLGSAAALGVADFCLAKYEMKAISSNGNLANSGSGDVTYQESLVAASRADGTPWVNVTRNQAQAECAALGDEYSLISNAQWQALARDVESQSTNFVNGVPVRGHSDGFPPSSLAAGADSDVYFATGNYETQSEGFQERRVWNLTSGDKIWDVGGNVHEWISDDLESLGMNPVLNGETVELSALSDINKLIFGPVSQEATVQSAFGKIVSAASGALLRGGAWTSAGAGGVYSALAVTSPQFAFNSFGFRCVYLPKAR